METDYQKVVRLLDSTIDNLTELKSAIKNAKIEPNAEQSLYLQERLHVLASTMKEFAK